MKTSWMTLACLVALTPACIIVADDGASPMGDGGTGDDGSDDGAQTEDDDSSDTGTQQDDDAGASDGSSESGAGSGGEMLECGEQALGDAGFEAGSPSTDWMESSATFGSPLCDAGCTEDPGAGPLDGEWYAWFGGVDGAEQASLSQPFTIDGDEATLSLQLAINAASGTGQDTFEVFVDDTLVFAVDDSDRADYPDYTPVSIDLSAWADGAEHTLAIEAEVLGGGITSFFVDSLELVACSEPATEDETGGSHGDSGSDSGSDESGDSGDSGTGGDETGESGDESTTG